jgi:hypothetical protein
MYSRQLSVILFQLTFSHRSPGFLRQKVWVSGSSFLHSFRCCSGEYPVYSPIIILRETVENTGRKSKFRYFIFILIFLFPWIFSVNQTDSLANGSMFFGALVLVFGLLWLVAKGLIWMVKRFFPSKSSFVWRQSLSNLFRPNNQTIILVIVIGLGRISALYAGLDSKQSFGPGGVCWQRRAVQHGAV